MDLVEDATRALELVGCKVTPIPVEARQTPDLLVEDSAGYLLVAEVKTRNDPEELTRDLNAQGLASAEIPFGASPNVRELLRTSRKQLANGPAASFRFPLFVLGSALFSDAHYEQLVDTLYGVRLMCHAISGDFRPCFLFDYAYFYNCREVPGVLAIHPGRASIGWLVNPFSPAKDDFLTTGLGQRLRAKKATFNPLKLGADDGVLVFDSDTVSSLGRETEGERGC